MIEAEERQHRRVRIVDVHLVVDGAQAELVGGADDLAALDAAAGHPHGEAVRIVIAALAALRRRRAAELARPHDERFLELTARREILEQRRDRLVDFPRLAQRAFVGVVVVIPILAVAAAGDDLHETHATLGEPARDEAARAEVTRLFIVDAVEFPRLGGFAHDVGGLGRGRLHAKRQLVGGDARIELRGGGAGLRGVAAVEPLREVERRALARRGLIRPAVDVENGCARGPHG